MPRLLPFAHRLAGALALAGCVAVPAFARERVTLRNGFSYDCSHHEAVDGQQVRLFLLTGDSTSYVDVPAHEVVTTEALPPAPVAFPAAVVPPAAAGAPADLHALLSTAATTHNIDAELLASIVHAESGGHARAVSHAGAGGLMQLMPSTAHDLGVNDRFEPGQNINGGTTYLDALLTRYHDNLPLALAAYNAGPGAVDRFHGIPPYRETRAYVVRVMTEFKRRKEALQHSAGHTVTATR